MKNYISRALVAAALLLAVEALFGSTAAAGTATACHAPPTTSAEGTVSAATSSVHGDVVLNRADFTAGADGVVVAAWTSAGSASTHEDPMIRGHNLSGGGSPSAYDATASPGPAWDG